VRPHNTAGLRLPQAGWACRDGLLRPAKTDAENLKGERLWPLCRESLAARVSSRSRITKSIRSW
jgi:hypothetical protein